MLIYREHKVCWLEKSFDEVAYSHGLAVDVISNFPNQSAPPEVIKYGNHVQHRNLQHLGGLTNTCILPKDKRVTSDVATASLGKGSGGTS
ncbi:MAG TPA: hypothetical protein DCZ75_13800 [Geobacter sp.]|nr:hypothetical protein [Geobacter sp.]